MSEVILYQETDEKGRPFVIEANSEEALPIILGYLTGYTEPVAEDDEDEYEEYSISHCQLAGKDRPPTEEERDADIRHLKDVIHDLSADPQAFFKKYHDKIPRKKNGTFAKGRYVPIWEGRTFCTYWEDSYGWGGPVLYLKTESDFRATILFAHRIIEKY